MAIELENPTLCQSLLATAPLHDDPERAWEFLKACGIFQETARDIFFAILEMEEGRGDVGDLTLAMRVEAPLYEYVTGSGDQLDPGYRRAKALWQEFSHRNKIAVPPTASLILRIGEFLTGVRATSPRPQLKHKEHSDSPLAALARSASWGEIAEQTEGAIDLPRLKLQAFALYARRDRGGLDAAMQAAHRVLDAPERSATDALYATVLLLELHLAMGDGPTVWRPLLDDARRLADPALILDADDLEDLSEALNRIEVANNELSPPAGPLLERLGFWTSGQLRRFFGFDSTWELDPGPPILRPRTITSIDAAIPAMEAIKTLSDRLGDEEKRRLASLLLYLELLSGYVGADSAEPFALDQLNVVRWGIRDHGGTEGLDTLLDLVSEEIVSPKDLLRVRDLLKSAAHV
jgi:hypothetical protein